jgi:hypothetical protein
MAFVKLLPVEQGPAALRYQIWKFQVDPATMIADVGKVLAV